MTDRANALAAASELVLTVESNAREIAGTDSESAVATVGSLTVEPGAVNVIPGRAELTVDIRDVDAASVERLVEAVEGTLETLRRQRGVETMFERSYDIPPRPMADRVTSALWEATAVTDTDAISLHSGTGHDATSGGYQRGPAVRPLARRPLS